MLRKNFYPEPVYQWARRVNYVLLSSVITFQKIALVPKMIWVRALKKVDDDGRKELKGKLHRLIGKLQAYQSENTNEVSIPEEFKSSCKATDDTPYVREPLPETFTDRDETLLVDLLYDIIGNEDLNDEMQALLMLTNDFV